MVEAAVLLISVAIIASIGLFVYARNPKHIVNKLYALLTVSFIFYPLANYLSLRTADRLIYIRAVIFFSVVGLASLYYLVFYLNNHDGKLNRLQKTGIYFTMLVAVLCWTPLVFKGLTAGEDPTPVSGPLAALFLLHFVSFPAASFMLLRKRIHSTRGVQRLQYAYMLLGIVPIVVLAPITAFIMPIVLKNTSLIFLSPVYAVTFVSAIGIAIIRHRLFDIRFFAVRAAAYLTTVTLISVGLILPSVLLFNYLTGERLSKSGIVLTVIGGVSLFYLLIFVRRAFDRMTTRIFFRHYYDPQQVLGRLGDILARTADINALRSDTAAVLQSVLQPSMFRYVLLAGPPDDARLAKSIGKYHVTSDVIDTEEHDGIDKSLVDFLRRENVAVAVKLHTKQEDLGYMLLGHKQSGEGYLDRDKQLLAVASGEIAIGLQNALRFEEIERFNDTLRVKIEEATKRLRQTNTKLRTLDETKDDFISMASHQLRTPLTSVKGYVSMVLDGDAGKITPLQRKLLNQSFVSSQRMVYLISDLLNLSRLRTGKFIIESAPCNVADVIQSEIEQLTETAKGRDLKLTYQKPEHFPTYMLDETKLRQVIMNFVDNAIYYTPSGGHISVNLVEKPTTIEFTVVDDGMGVPKAEQHHLFTKFFRANNAKRARPDGTGLGLFMAKKVIIAQGGAIIFRSTEGKGSTFGFSFAKDKLEPVQK